MTDFYTTDLRDGAAQSQRFPVPLKDKYFKIDGLTQNQLMLLGMRLARNLKFINANNEEAGSWEKLFLNEPLFVCAEIVNTDITQLKNHYRYSMSDRSIQGRAKYIRKLALQIDGWLSVLRLADQPHLVQLTAKLNEIIRHSLADRLAGVHRLIQGAQYIEVAQQDVQARGFSAAWQPGGADANQARSAASQYDSEATGSQHEQQKTLSESFDRLCGTIAFIKDALADGLDPGASNKNMNPAVSMYVTFTKLFAHAQEKLNNFPGKRLNFYYSKLLQVEQRSAQPDAVNIALTLTPGHSPLFVPSGTEFLAGKGAEGNEVIFSSDDDVVLSNTTVREVRTLCFEKDPLISPAYELGCVTRIKAAELDAAAQHPNGNSLFEVTATEDALDVKLGLALASPLLYLREGERTITLDLECDVGEHLPENDNGLVALFATVKTPEEFYSLLGQVIAKDLLSSEAWLSDNCKDRIGNTAKQLEKGKHLVWGEKRPLTPVDSQKVIANFPAIERVALLIPEREARLIHIDSQEVIAEILAFERVAHFHQLFRNTFNLQLTLEDGWMCVKNYTVAALPTQEGRSRAGLRLVMTLTTDDPEIVGYNRDVHAGNLNTNLPIVSMEMNKDSMFFSYSLLAALNIRSVNVAVNVFGAKALVAYNNYGPVDATKPFYPFGPQPSRDSYLAIGHYEAVKKSLTKAVLNIQWGGLPTEPGGFEEYYRGYPTEYGNAYFLTRAAVLESNAWSIKDSKPQKMFTSDKQTGQPNENCQIDLLQSYSFFPLETGFIEEDYHLDNRSRKGFFRFDLGLCEEAFGHIQYPRILSSVLTANAKRRRRQLPPPNPPYTPLINQISMDYAAESTIRFRNEVSSQAASGADRLFHIHPFGTRELVQSGRTIAEPLIPRFSPGGYLLLGLSGDHLPGQVSVLFDLRNGLRKRPDQAVKTKWHYLSSDVMRPLPAEHFLRNTTANFTQGGLVTIELPRDITNNNTLLPDDLYWLVIAAEGDISLCPRLYGMRTGALRAVRKIGSKDNSIRSITDGTIKEMKQVYPGISKVEQLGDSFGGRPEEDYSDLVTRTSERLRHKDRASQPWDYERLVLERFTDLYKVKCFANMSMDQEKPSPGNVLIVVVPRLTDTGAGFADRLLVDPEHLKEIQKYISTLSSKFSRIEVQNADYEIVQIRCATKFVQPHRHGILVRDLSRDISNYISPWHTGGYGASFGWCIRRKDVEAFIGALDYVDYVTDFSMLHITQDHITQDHITQDHIQSYRLNDTARQLGAFEDVQKAVLARDEIHPRVPWSLALPSRQHYITSMSKIEERDAQETGVGELEVGSTLILDAS